MPAGCRLPAASAHPLTAGRAPQGRTRRLQMAGRQAGRQVRREVGRLLLLAHRRLANPQTDKASEATRRSALRQGKQASCRTLASDGVLQPRECCSHSRCHCIDLHAILGGHHNRQWPGQLWQCQRHSLQGGSRRERVGLRRRRCWRRQPSCCRAARAVSGTLALFACTDRDHCSETGRRMRGLTMAVASCAAATRRSPPQLMYNRATGTVAIFKMYGLATPVQSTAAKNSSWLPLPLSAMS